MKSKVIYGLNFLWACFTAFSFPIFTGVIFSFLTGHSKGYDYDLGSEKDISVMFGFIVLFIWLALSLPSNIYVFHKTAKKSRLHLLIPAAVYLMLAVSCICIGGGWAWYLKEFYNIRT